MEARLECSPSAPLLVYVADGHREHPPGTPAFEQLGGFMSRTTARNVVFCSVLCFGILGGASAAPRAAQDGERTASDTSATAFRERIAAYMQMRQAIVADLLHTGGIDRNADEGRPFRRTLAVAMRAARRESRAGEIFCPAVADRMREMVWTAMLGEDDVLSEVPMVKDVRVNDFYPEGEPLATVPPWLLQQFDPLPPELQYRFLANALILLDIDTTLIVDFIPNAFDRS
jgi:urease gamma subunit